MKEEIYRIVDSFLTEAKDQNGNERSLDRLNADRHLAVEEFTKLITKLLEELRIKQKDYKYDEENEDSCFQTFETLGEAYIEGENYCARKINSKIDKILNK